MTIQALFEQYRNTLLDIASKYTRCTEDAEDAVQNTYLRIRDSYTPGTSGISYAKQAVKWLSLNALAANTKQQYVNINDVAELAATAPEAEICISNLLSTLPTQQRLILEAYSNGVTLRNYALTNNINLETVRSGFRLAVNKLKEVTK